MFVQFFYSFFCFYRRVFVNGRVERFFVDFFLFFFDRLIFFFDCFNLIIDSLSFFFDCFNFFVNIVYFFLYFILFKLF